MILYHGGYEEVREPHVIQSEIGRDFGFAFYTTDMDWLDLVVRCRGNVAYRHDYDIVIGKIANDNVGETVSYVMQGIMRREDAVQRLRFEKINNQIAFCTDDALCTLRFLESHQVEVKE